MIPQGYLVEVQMLGQELDIYTYRYRYWHFKIRVSELKLIRQSKGRIMICAANLIVLQ